MFVQIQYIIFNQNKGAVFKCTGFTLFLYRLVQRFLTIVWNPDLVESRSGWQDPDPLESRSGWPDPAPVNIHGHFQDR
jgi:hypothetical protein